MLTPETVVVAEARRSLTTLSLYGYRVDGVIANRVFPEGGGDAWRAGLGGGAAGGAGRGRASPSPTCPIWRSGYQRRRADRASTALAAFAEAAYDGDDPLAVPDGGDGTADDHAHRARARCCASRCRSRQRQDVDLARHGDELVVTVGSYRRLLVAARRR